MGIESRLLYGGIVEEVLIRWGLMSLLAWIFGLILSSGAALWSSIVVAGIVFGLAHMPSYFAAGCRKSVAVITGMIVLNLWAGIVFGYLFSEFGITSAVLSHMVLHVCWYPFDVVFRARRRSESPSVQAPG